MVDASDDSCSAGTPESFDPPPRKRLGGSGISLAAAQAVAERSPRELSAPAAIRTADARSYLARRNRAARSRDLERWAARDNLLIPSESFTCHWLQQGRVGGQESDVYFDEEKEVFFKRNSGIAYEDWVQFFKSVRLHNWLFPATAYTLEGFSTESTGLHCVLSQPGVASRRGATREEVASFLAEVNFHHTEHDHYENELLLIQDLHDENVLIGKDGELYFIDTCIYFKDGAPFPLP